MQHFCIKMSKNNFLLSFVLAYSKTLMRAVFIEQGKGKHSFNMAFEESIQVFVVLLK